MYSVDGESDLEHQSRIIFYEPNNMVFGCGEKNVTLGINFFLHLAKILFDLLINEGTSRILQLLQRKL